MDLDKSICLVTNEYTVITFFAPDGRMADVSQDFPSFGVLYTTKLVFITLVNYQTTHLQSLQPLLGCKQISDSAE